MTNGDLMLAWEQHQEYLANRKFEEGPGFLAEEIIAQDAYISEEERWEELCLISQRQS